MASSFGRNRPFAGFMRVAVPAPGIKPLPGPGPSGPHPAGRPARIAPAAPALGSCRPGRPCESFDGSTSAGNVSRRPCLPTRPPTPSAPWLPHGWSRSGREQRSAQCRRMSCPGRAPVASRSARPRQAVGRQPGELAGGQVGDRGEGLTRITAAMPLRPSARRLTTPVPMLSPHRTSGRPGKRRRVQPISRAASEAKAASDGLPARNARHPQCTIPCTRSVATDS